jgi:hypothetical protein
MVRSTEQCSTSVPNSVAEVEIRRFHKPSKVLSPGMSDQVEITLGSKRNLVGCFPALARVREA